MEKTPEITPPDSNEETVAKEEPEVPENGKEEKIKSEETEGEMEVDGKPDAPAPVALEEVKKPEVPKPQPVKELDEKQKSALRNAYKFPNEPSILVHPHPKAKSGKFDCTVMNLSVLLDYCTEDNKENTFEVSL